MTIWLVSDTHFGHKNILTFEDDYGNLIRPGFSSVEEMDELIVQNWNNVISDGDKVYHLGDVFFGDGWKHLSRLKGKKRLILGNHDDGKNKHLQQHFGKIYMWRVFYDLKVVLTHVPILLYNKGKFSSNIHGHIHQNNSPTLDHYNVSVEKTGYKLIALDDVVKSINSIKDKENNPH